MNQAPASSPLVGALSTSATSGYTFFRGSTGFRKNWLTNLYSKRSSVGPSPSPNLSVYPEPENPCPQVCQEPL